MSKLKTKLLSVFALLFLAFLFPAEADAAISITVESPATSLKKGEQFQVDVNANFENNLVFGTDILFTFPSNKIEVVDVSNGGLFPDFASPTSSYGTIEIRAYTSNPYEYKTGAGKVATITLKTTDAFDGADLGLNCSGTDVINNDGINILDCSNLSGRSVELDSGSGTNPTEPPATEPPAGEPNSCGGTCGSNSNCKANYYCFEGYCRAPLCPTQGDCDCSKASSSNDSGSTSGIGGLISKVIKKATPKPTPQVVTLAAGELTVPAPTFEPVNPEDLIDKTEIEVEPSSTLRGFLSSPLVKTIAIGLGVFFALILIIAVINNMRNHNEPPKIMHPENL